jgi:membrane dipeptidase
MPTRRDFLKTVAAAGAVLPGSPWLAAGAQPAAGGGIDALFDRAIVIDSLSVVGGSRRELEDEDWAAIRRSGYSAIQTTLNSGSLQAALNDLRDWHRRFQAHPDRLLKVVTAGDIRRAKAEKKLGVMLGFQNATMIESDVGNLDILHALGTRCIQLTYNSRNLLGDGCTERTQAGLSDFGVAAVERMNELGIVVDLSHCGTGTTRDGIELSRRPPCFTHTMCQAVYSPTVRHPRAKTDDELKALAARGGVAGMAALGYFVGPEADTGLDRYLDHVQHAVKVMGIDHVGVCTDFSVRGISSWATRENWYEPRLRNFKPSYNVRWPPWIPELDAPERFRTVAHALDRRGWTAGDIERVLGLNWLRYFGDVLGGAATSESEGAE